MDTRLRGYDDGANILLSQPELAPNGPHVSSPSTGGKLPENAQDVRFSDDATGMSHRNDDNFPKRAGNTNELGRLSFGYFSFGEAKKSDSPGAKQNLKSKAGSPLREDGDSLLNRPHPLIQSIIPSSAWR